MREHSVCRAVVHTRPRHLAQINGRCLSHMCAAGVLRVAATVSLALSHLSVRPLTGSLYHWRIFLQRLSYLLYILYYILAYCLI